MMRIITVILFLLIAAPAFSQIGATLRRGAADTTFNLDSVQAIPSYHAHYAGWDIDGDGIKNEESSGASISTWVDISGNGYDALDGTTPLTVSTTTYNTNNAITFPGGTTDDNYFHASSFGSFSSDQHHTIFIVFKSTNNGGLTNNYHLFAFGENFGDNNRSIVTYSQEGAMTDGLRLYGGNQLYSPRAFSINVTNILTLRWKGAGNDRELYNNGVLQSYSSSANSTAAYSFTDTHFTIGSTWTFNSSGTVNHFEGDVLEVIVFLDDLSDEYRAEVEEYLRSKWSL